MTAENDVVARYRRLLAGQHRCQEALRRRSAEKIAAVLTEWVRPASALDVGCGTGLFLAALEGVGICDLRGVDGPWLDGTTLGFDHRRITCHDLERPFDLGRRFGLVASLEVAEHLAPERADGFVADLTRHGDLVLFSAAVPFQGGAGHRNERWPSWWAGKFDRNGFVCLDLFRPRLWDDTEVLWWLRQNLLLYVRRERLAAFPRLQAFHRSGGASMPLDVVHPVLLAQRVMEHRAAGPAAASPDGGG